MAPGLDPEGPRVKRVEFKSLLNRHQRLVVAACPVENQPKDDVAVSRDRVKLARAPGLGDSFLMPLHLGQIFGVPLAREGIAWVEFQSALVLRFRTRPIPVITLFYVREHSVGFRDRFVESQSLQGGHSRLLISLSGRTDPINAEETVGLGETRISLGVSGVKLNRPCE